jgi:hypothetical protein
MSVHRSQWIEQTYSSQDLIEIKMVLQNPIRKLVELVDKVSDVDTAHRIGLRERHGLRKVLPESSAAFGISPLNLHSQLLKLSGR